LVRKSSSLLEVVAEHAVVRVAAAAVVEDVEVVAVEAVAEEVAGAAQAAAEKVPMARRGVIT